MSNSKSAIQEIKSLMVKFGFLTEDVKLLDFKMDDNTILRTESLEIGKSIVKIDEQFNQVNLEDGTYRLKNNFEIKVKDSQIETVKELFLDAKLEDGTVIKIAGDQLTEGAKVVVVQGDSEVPAPDGTHTLDDGDQIETKDGVITKIIDADNENEKTETPEAPSAEPASEGKGAEQQMIELLKEFVSKISEKMNQMESQFGTLEKDFNDFKKQPASRKIGDGKTEFNKTEETELESRVNTILSLRKSINN